MFQQIKLNFKTMILSSLAGLLGACADGPAEMPGNLSNPKLAELINVSLQDHILRMDPKSSPGFIPQAAANAQLWLKEINEVVARCRYGPKNNSRFNLFEYDIKLTSGELIQSVFSSRRCSYSTEVPLIMRVKFKSGRAIDVFTDGRELKQPVDMVRSDIQGFIDTVVKADLRRNPARYLQPDKTAEQIAKEWAIER
jgi:hypothetical protein